MRIGTIAYRTKTGLGYQIKDYVDHLPITKIMVVDLSRHNGLPLENWFEGAQVVEGYPRPRDLNEFLREIDAILLAETPLNYDLYDMARDRGIKTAVVPNWEFWDYYIHPDYPIPDVLIMPSMWHYEDAQKWAAEKGIKCTYIHHPVDRNVFKYRQRTTKKFFHVAGKQAVYDRNGTWQFMAACPNGVVTTQTDDLAWQIRHRYRQSNVFTNIKDPSYIYQLGDIMVLPRRYGGNCLPLNEALSSGCPVIMPDISPNNHILPKEWLVPATITDHFEPRTRVDIYTCDEQALREKLEWFRGCDIQAESEKANKIADTISWEAIGHKFIEALK